MNLENDTFLATFGTSGRAERIIQLSTSGTVRRTIWYVDLEIGGGMLNAEDPYASMEKDQLISMILTTRLSRRVRYVVYQHLNILRNSSRQRLSENSSECIREMSSVSWLK